MPRLQLYTSNQPLPSAGQGVALASSKAFAGVGSGLMALGRGISQVGEGARQVQEYRNAIFLAKTTAELRNQATVRMLNARETAPEGAPNFAKDRLAEYDKDAQKLIKDAPLTVQRALQAKIQIMRGGVKAQALGFEVTQRLKKRMTDVEDTIKLNANSIINDPAQAETALQETKTAIDALPLPGDKKRDLYTKAKETYAGASLLSRIDTQPDKVHEELKSGVWDDKIDHNLKIRLMHRATVIAKREADKKKREEAYDVTRSYKNEVARVQDTGQRAGEFDHKRAIEVLGKKKADEYKDILDRTERVYWDGQKMVAMKPDEIADYLDSRKPDRKSATYDRDREEYRALSGVAARIIKQREDDPAAYVLRNNENLKAAYESLGAEAPDYLKALDPNNKDIIAQARAMMEAQKKLGVDQRYRSPITKAAAQNIAGQIVGEGDPAKLAEQLQALGLAYGEYYPKVLNQITKTGKLSSAFTVAAGMVSEGQDAARRDLVIAAKAGEKSYDKDLSKSDRDTFDAKVKSASEKLWESMRMQGQGRTRYDQQVDGIRLLAKKYHADGLSVSEAVDKAFKAVVGDEYHFTPTYRIPNTLRSESGQVTATNPKAIRDMTYWVLSDIESFKDKIDTSRVKSTTPGQTPEDIKARYLKALLIKGRWVTSPSEQGVNLYDEQGQPVKLKNGKDLYLPFAGVTDETTAKEIVRQRYGVSVNIKPFVPKRDPISPNVQDPFSPPPGGRPEDRLQRQPFQRRGEAEPTVQPASLQSAETDTTNVIDPSNEGYTQEVQQASVSVQPSLRPKGVRENVGLVSPLDAYRITSNFGYRTRPNTPAGKGSRLHGGIDLGAPTGSPVKVAMTGVVRKAGWFGGYGNFIEVEHANGLVTRYAHLSKIDVKRGETIQAGADIGKVGSTGRSSGPHLHFEVVKNGKAVDPRSLLAFK